MKFYQSGFLKISIVDFVVTMDENAFYMKFSLERCVHCST